MRRALIILLLAGILGAIGWWLVRWSGAVVPGHDPWQAVPSTSAVVLEIPDLRSGWERFTGTTQLWGAMEHLPGCAALDKLLRAVIEAMPGADAADPAPLLLVLPAGGQDDLLLIWSLPHARGHIAGMGPALGADLGEASSLWNGGTITLRPDTALPALHARWHEGLFLVATSTALLDDGAASLERTAPDSAIAEARKTFGNNADAHLLVQPERAARMLARWLDPRSIGVSEVPEGWLALDVRLRPDVVLLGGLLFTRTGTSELRAWATQRPDRSALARVLPARTNWLRAVQVDHPAAYFHALNGTDTATALFTAYTGWLQGSVGEATAFLPGDTLPARWAVVQCIDPTLAREALNGRCPDGHCDTTAYRGVRIATSAEAGALGQVYGAGFDDIQRPLWAVLGDKVVFTDRPGWMREAIDAWTDGSSLALDARGGRFFQQYTSDATLSWWADGARSFIPLRSMAWPATATGMDRWSKVWQALGGCLLEVTPEREGVHQVTVCLQHAPIDQVEVGALWSASIDAPAARRPWLLKDHLSKTLLILAQGDDHRASLISCTGKVLWQRPLDGPIIGEVRQVDRYRNGKLQMLFNTAGAVHMIDRNGQDVEGFPIKLATRTDQPLALFDYEGRKDYRILLADSSGRVLNWSAEGRPVEGWAPRPLPSAPASAVTHFRLLGKDLLVTACADGSVHISDRRGEQGRTADLRMQGLERFLGFREGPDPDQCVALWTDTSGAVLSGTFNGRVDTLQRSMGGEVRPFDTGLRDPRTYLRTRRDSVLLYDGASRVLGTFLPAAGGEMAFPVPRNGGPTLLGLVDGQREQVRLLDRDGRAWPGTPLKGAVSFRVADINMDEVLELITATSDGNVVVYAIGQQR